MITLLLAAKFLDMKKALSLLGIAVLAYVGFEAVAAYLRHRQRALTPAGTVREPRDIEPLGTVPGAAMTGGGQGKPVSDGRDDTLPDATRVGRGVV
jgi:hypothetical protein